MDSRQEPPSASEDLTAAEHSEKAPSVQAPQLEDAVAPPALVGTTGPVYPAYPRWLKWFLILFVSDLLLRGITGVSVGRKWAEQLEMKKLPLGLPTSAELKRARESETETALGRYWRSVASVAAYYNPVPNAGTRQKLGSVQDWGKYALLWLDTRLRFVGRLTGTNHSWPMFSPSTRRSRTVVRGKLIYDDGTSRTALSLVEPGDFDNYSRWLIKRPQKNDERLDTHYSARMGKCNYWAHRFGRNKTGAKLKTIELFKLTYRFPARGRDVSAHWKRVRKQAKPATFWSYDVAKRKGKDIKPEQAQATPAAAQEVNTASSAKTTSGSAQVNTAPSASLATAVSPAGDGAESPVQGGSDGGVGEDQIWAR